MMALQEFESFCLAMVRDTESRLTRQQKALLFAAVKPCIQIVLPDDYQQTDKIVTDVRVFDLAKDEAREQVHISDVPPGSFLAVVGTFENPMQFVSLHKIKAVQ